MPSPKPLPEQKPDVPDAAPVEASGGLLGSAGKMVTGQQQAGTGHGLENAAASVMSTAGNVGKGLWQGVTGTRDINTQQLDALAGQTGPAAQATINEAQTRQAAGADLGAQNQSRDMQMQLMQQLQGQAAGRGPSLAQMQLQRGTDQNIAQAMALGQSQRGAGQAGMLKGIQNQQAGIATGMAQDAAMARMQEQMQAQNMLGSNLQGMRGQDVGVAGMGLQNNQFNTLQSNQGSQFNATAANQGGQFNAGQTNTLMNANAQRQAAAAQAQLAADIEAERMRNEQKAKEGDFISKALSTVASVVASDENLKTDIVEADDAIIEFLDGINAHEYKYKDDKWGKGRRVSPMAQEMEKSKLGKEFVVETKEGKLVDYGKALGTMMASLSTLHKRLKKFEDD